MTGVSITFHADEQTLAELRRPAGDGNLSDAIRELIHAHLYRLRSDTLLQYVS